MATRVSIATVVAAVGPAAACGGPMTEAQPRQTALDYVVMSHPDGVADLQVTESRATIQGATAASGEVAIRAQG